MKGPALLIGVGKASSADKEKSESAGESSSEFSAALDDAVDALDKHDKAGAKAALSAAITAKCAELYSDEED